MPSQLLVNVLEVTVPAYSYVEVEHDLRSNDLPVAPKLVQPDRVTALSVDSVNATTVSISNNTDGELTAKFRFERGLSNEVDVDFLPNMFWQGSSLVLPPGPCVSQASVGLTDQASVPAEWPTACYQNFTKTGAGNVLLSNIPIVGVAIGSRIVIYNNSFSTGTASWRTYNASPNPNNLIIPQSMGGQIIFTPGAWAELIYLGGPNWTVLVFHTPWAPAP